MKYTHDPEIRNSRKVKEFNTSIELKVKYLETILECKRIKQLKGIHAIGHINIR
jgi:hypothetical protein